MASLTINAVTVAVLWYSVLKTSAAVSSVPESSNKFPLKQDNTDSTKLHYSFQTPSFRLIRDLTDPDRYSKHVRPVRNDSHPVDLTMRMNLGQILDVNEPNQNVKLYMWVMQLWKDEFLGWDPVDYGGINWTVLSYDQIWLPDTYLYNSLQMERETSERWISAIVTTNKTKGMEPFANIRFQYPAIYEFSCKMHILHFPFDVQNCTMMFGSWVYDAAGIRYFTALDRVRNESFVENEEWSVLSFQIIRQENRYTCCPHPYTELHAHLVIQRKPLYYIVNLVVPTSIIALIAIVGFFTPASSSGERSEKINLGITTLLAMSILLLMVSDQMPATSNYVPWIGWFFLSIILLISLGTFLTGIIILIQQQGHYGRPVPKWARTLCFTCLSKCLLMRPPADVEEKHKSQVQEGSRVPKKRKSSTVGNSPESEELFRKDVTGEPLLRSAWGEYINPSLYNTQADRNMRGVSNGSPVGSSGSQLSMNVMHIHEILKAFQRHFRQKEEQEIIPLEWEYLTAVLDRFFLVVFSVAVVFVTVMFLIGGSWNYVTM